MDAPHLNELRRQRALVAEHLAWLDREIAAHPPAPAIPTAPAPSPASTPSISTTTRSPLDAETILVRYADSPENSVRDAKRGCLIIFFAAFAVLLLGVGFWYYKNYDRLKAQANTPAANAQR